MEGQNAMLMSLQIECTYYFEENPFALETPQSLSSRLGRAVDRLEPVLDRLVSLAILSRIGDGAEAIYRYNQPFTTREKLDDQWKQE